MMNRFDHISLVTFALAVSVVVGCTPIRTPQAISAATTQPDFRALDRYVEERLTAADLPGLALAVTQGDEVLYLKGYGSAGRNEPITPQTQFHIASVSKSFTALAGLVLPLLLIGGLKFTQFEVQALKPMISSAPWLAWMYTVFGENGASYLLGIVEIATALLLITSRWLPHAGVIGGALGALTFFVTVTLFSTLPVWEASLGGFPALSGLGSFLIKDIAFLGIALVVMGESLKKLSSKETK
jgi:reactive chlorine resistance protein C